MIEEVDTMRVYLCGPMADCTDDEAGGWREDAAKYLNARGITTLNPMDRRFRYYEYGDDPTSVLPDLVEEDKIDIEMSDVLLVNYTKISAGTNMEVILGWQTHKRVIVVAPEDMSLSPWVHYHCHDLFHDMDEAYNRIVEFNNRIRK